MWIFALTFLDSALSILKIKAIQQNRKYIASVLNSLAYAAFIILMSIAVVDENVYTILSIVLAKFLGTLVTLHFTDKYKKDKVWVFDIKSPTREEGECFSSQMRENRLAVMTYDGYNERQEKVLNSKIYSQNKDQSKLIEQFIPGNFKYSVVEVKNYIE